MHGTHMIKSWSSTQSVIALSSGEAEYYALVNCAPVGTGVHSMLKEIGIQIRLKLTTDASAAIGISKRRGLGKVRHIDVSQLWVQEKVNQKEIQITKVQSKENLSDALTKAVSGPEIEWHVQFTNQERFVQ